MSDIDDYVEEQTFIKPPAPDPIQQELLKSVLIANENAITNQLTIRDQFAMKALESLLLAAHALEDYTYDDFAEMAYHQADAMMVRRGK